MAGWAPAGSIERFLSAVEELLALSGDRHRRLLDLSRQTGAPSSSTDSSRHGAADCSRSVTDGSGASIGGAAPSAPGQARGAQAGRRSSAAHESPAAAAALGRDAEPAAADDERSRAESPVRQQMARFGSAASASADSSSHGGTAVAQHGSSAASGCETAAQGNRQGGLAGGGTRAGADSASASGHRSRQLLAQPAAAPADMQQLSAPAREPGGVFELPPQPPHAAVGHTTRHGSLELSGSYAAQGRPHCSARVLSSSRLSRGRGGGAGGGGFGPDNFGGSSSRGLSMAALSHLAARLPADLAAGRAQRPSFSFAEDGGDGLMPEQHMRAAWGSWHAGFTPLVAGLLQGSSAEHAASWHSQVRPSFTFVDICKQFLKCTSALTPAGSGIWC